MRTAVLAACAAGALCLAAAPWLAQQKGDLKAKLKDTEVGPGWIYDDLGAGVAEARKSGKPLLIAFR